MIVRKTAAKDLSTDPRPRIADFDSGFGGLTRLRSPGFAGAGCRTISISAIQPGCPTARKTLVKPSRVILVRAAPYLKSAGRRFGAIGCNTASCRSGSLRCEERGCNSRDWGD